MDLDGGRWNLRKKRRRNRPGRVLLLVLLITAALYVERVIVPRVPPPFIPTPTPTRSPASLLLEAETFFQAGKLSQAEESYQQALKVDPLNVMTFVDLARVQVFAGDYEAAQESASNALLLDPDSAHANAIAGWVLDFLAFEVQEPAERSELINQALEKIERAVAANSESALIQAYYAEVLIDYDAADYEDALGAAQKAVQIDPNLMEAQRALGYVWESTGNYDQAIDAYQVALRIHPNLAILHVAVGNMYQALGDVDAAIDSYLRAVALDPTDPDPLTLIASAEARRGNYGKASQYAADAVDKEPENPRLHGNLGRMYYKNNELDKALVSLRLAVQGGQLENGAVVEGLPLDPGDSRVLEFYYTYALALAKDGNCEMAGQIFEALLRIAPDNEIVVANAEEGLRICDALVVEDQPAPEAEASQTP